MLQSVRKGTPESAVERGVHLLFDRCRFDEAQDVDAGDTVYAVANPSPGGTVIVRASTRGAGLADWFAPGCGDCRLEP